MKNVGFLIASALLVILSGIQALHNNYPAAIYNGVMAIKQVTMRLRRHYRLINAPGQTDTCQAVHLTPV